VFFPDETVQLTRGELSEPGIKEDDVSNRVAEEGRHLEDLAYRDVLDVLCYPLLEAPLGPLNQSCDMSINSQTFLVQVYTTVFPEVTINSRAAISHNQQK
jgi:hypothetical protein